MLCSSRKKRIKTEKNRERFSQAKPLHKLRRVNKSRKAITNFIHVCWVRFQHDFNRNSIKVVTLLMNKRYVFVLSLCITFEWKKKRESHNHQHTIRFNYCFFFVEFSFLFSLAIWKVSPVSDTEHFLCTPLFVPELDSNFCFFFFFFFHQR